MKRRTGPLAAMGCLGLMGVVFFGGMVSWMSDKPIIRLRPELEKLYGVNGFRCSLHLAENRLDVELPPKLVLPDRFARRKLGAEALIRYLRLTKNRTQVETVQVLSAPVEVVTMQQAQQVLNFPPYAQEVVRVATLEGAAPIGSLTLSAGIEGVAIRMDVACDDAAVRRAVTRVLNVPDVSFVQVRRGGVVVQESGRDAKILATGAIAPVSSPTR